jgi:hypothetical protein
MIEPPTPAAPAHRVGAAPAGRRTLAPWCLSKQNRGGDAAAVGGSSNQAALLHTWLENGRRLDQLFAERSTTI